LISIKDRNLDIGYVRPATGAIHMSLSSAARNILSRIADWWHDREDERLDELVASYEKVSATTTEPGVTAYHLASHARSSNRES
jgi:hypothetical protein